MLSFRAPEGAREILPRQRERRGGASVVRRDPAVNRTEDLDVNISEKALTRNGNLECGCCKAVAADEGSRRRLQASTRHRHAAIPGGCDDCGDDEGHRLAAALGARLSC